MAVDEGGRVHCILGYRREDQPHDLVYYSPSVALLDRDGKAFIDFSPSFVQLALIVLCGRHCAIAKFLRSCSPAS